MGLGEAVRAASPAVRRRAAELVGKGATCKEAGAAVGFCERTVREWLKRPELDALVRQARQNTLDPTVAGALLEALGALTRDGRPDHATRLRAAALLLANPEAIEPPEEFKLLEGAILVTAEGQALAAGADGA